MSALRTHRHAYLIMAHDNWTLLETLLKLIDAPFNEIFLHIDSKSRDFNRKYFLSLPKNAAIHLTKRHSVTWGNESQIKAEMELFKTAFANGPFWMYHFISGSDLPLKSNEEIYDFFEENHTNFIRTDDSGPWEWRLKTYINVFRSRWIPKPFRKRLNAWSDIIQSKFRVNRLKKLRIQFPIFGYGDNWCSLTNGAIKELLDNSKKIKRMTRFTYCSDELYKQIILLNQPSDKIGSISNRQIRMIDWDGGGGHPKVFTSADFDSLMKSQCLFARKFDLAVDSAVVNRISDTLHLVK